MNIELRPGDALTGLLVDGVDGTPWIAGTLQISSDGRLVLEVPYLRGEDSGQFAHVDEWVRPQSQTRNLILVMPAGRASLFGVSSGGYSGQPVVVGRLRPTEVVLHERDGELADPLAVTTLRSQLDGLNEWGRASAIEVDHTLDAANLVTAIAVTVRSADVATWRHGTATLSVRSHWSTSTHGGRGLAIADDLVLESTFDDGARPIADHLAEQRKVASLLTILHGNRAAFRRHHVQDRRFVEYSLGGTPHGTPFVELLSTATLQDAVREAPDPQRFAQPLAFLADIGDASMQRWATEYDRWKRFILPVASSFSRTGAYLEDAIFSLGSAFEAAGPLIGARPAEEVTYGGNSKPTLLTMIYRCVDLVDIDFGAGVTSNVGLARFLKDLYNTIKHPDRGDLPEPLELYVGRQLGQLIARLIALHITGGGEEKFVRYRSGSQARHEQQLLSDNGMMITDDGTLTTSNETAPKINSTRPHPQT